MLYNSFEVQLYVYSKKQIWNWSILVIYVMHCHEVDNVIM